MGGSTLRHAGTFSEKNFLSPEGQTAYGDHGYVFYPIPSGARRLPIVFQHGGAQTKRTWESTPGGREGFQNIFLRKRYSVCLVDQPHMGEAGLSTRKDEGGNAWAGNPLFADQTFFRLCRLGDGNGLFKGSQFPGGAAAVDAFQRSWNPYSGPLDNELNAKVLGQLFERIGPAVLMAHSMGGTIAWRTPFYTNKVRVIVALEPGGTPFVFPETEMPRPVKAVFEPLSATAVGVPMEKFLKLTRMLLLLIYGDYIADKPVTTVGSDKWCTELEMARQFAAAVNRHEGEVRLVHMREIGICGNSRFLMAERNTRQIAELIQDWLHAKGLDR